MYEAYPFFKKGNTSNTRHNRFIHPSIELGNGQKSRLDKFIKIPLQVSSFAKGLKDA